MTDVVPGPSVSALLAKASLAFFAEVNRSVAQYGTYPPPFRVELPAVVPTIAKPAPAAKPRRRRRSLAAAFKQAAKLGGEVTVTPDGVVKFTALAKDELPSNEPDEVEAWISKHARH